jgi:hypothetical protein
MGALVAGLGANFATGLAVGLAAGLAGGLAVSDHHAWPAYLATSYRLAWEGQLPRHLMQFLDDAHRLGLLRAVGPVYQFRHAELQDHLAAAYRSRGKSRTDPRGGQQI